MGSTTELHAVTIGSDELSAVARAAAAELVGVDETAEGAFIRTPLMYPGGANVVVHVVGSADRYFISDYGYGALEAEMAGGSRHYTALARPIGEQLGISFDDRCLFTADVPRAQLPAAVAVIANATLRAVALTVMRLSHHRHRHDDEALYQRLVNLFGRPRVERHVEVTGASTIPWRVSALIRRDDAETIFDWVKPARQSIYMHVTMFHDIARLERPPTRVAVVESLGKLGGDELALLSQAAKVIEQGASEEAYLKAA
jgi:hypothetical protein